MNAPNGKKYVYETKRPIMPILMWLIKNNRTCEVRRLLDLESKYFYPEAKGDRHKLQSCFLQIAEDIKEMTCYTSAAIEQKNPEMLKLLLNHGFAAKIINEKTLPARMKQARYLLWAQNIPIRPSHL